MRFTCDNSACRPFFRRRRPAVLMMLSLFLLFQSCATSRFTAGEQKNLLPIADGPHLEEVHSIAVMPFYQDKHHWRPLVQEALLSPRITVVPAARVDAAVRDSWRDLSAIDLDLRPQTLAKIGRSLNADAVVNGLVLPRGDHYELVLQLISSRDSRLLFWQAVEFSLSEGRADPNAQRLLIKRMLNLLVANAGRKQRPVPAAAQRPETQIREREQAPGERQNMEGPAKEEKPQRQKRRERTPAPAVVPEEISPM